MESKTANDPPRLGLWPSLGRAGARSLMVEGSEFLFLERSEGGGALSAQAARGLASFHSAFSKDSILLLDGDYRVRALVGLEQLADFSIKDFSRIKTIGLVPSLSRQLGHWKRERLLKDGLWSVAF